MKTDIIRDIFNYSSISLSVKCLVEKTGYTYDFCYRAVKALVEGGELTDDIMIRDRQFYQAIDIKKSKSTIPNRAADFLNSQGIGYKFNRFELSNFVVCNNKSLSTFLSGMVKLRLLSISSPRKGIASTYKVIGIIPNEKEKVRGNSKPEVRADLSKDLMHIFAYGGNASVICENLHH